MQNSLQYLLTDDFRVKFGFLLPPEAARNRFQRMEAVKTLAGHIRTDVISEEEIRDFSKAMASRFCAGEFHPDEYAMAALATVMECLPNDYAEEYLLDLAKLERPEMPTAIRVARLCLAKRFEQTKTVVKRAKFSNDPLQSQSVGPALIQKWEESEQKDEVEEYPPFPYSEIIELVPAGSC